MQKKVDLSTREGHLVEVVIERADEQQPWSLAVRVRDIRDGAWSDPWMDAAHDYFTCHDALAAGKAQAARMIGSRSQDDPA